VSAVDKKSLTERDICSKFITPAVVQAGWDAMEQIREEVSFTKGRIIVRGKLVTRGKLPPARSRPPRSPNLGERRAHARSKLVRTAATCGTIAPDVVHRYNSPAGEHYADSGL